MNKNKRIRLVDLSRYIDECINENELLLQFLKKNRILIAYRKAHLIGFRKYIKLTNRDKEFMKKLVYERFKYIKKDPKCFANHLFFDTTKPPKYWKLWRDKYINYCHQCFLLSLRDYPKFIKNIII